MSNRLQEWAPLTDLFNRLPAKAQNGIFTQDIKLTCIDVLPEFLALGTNIGLVYWYDRKKKDLQKLRCENPSSAITAVKIISTVDYMVACGNNDGNISIFQVPKSHHESLPESMRPKNMQVERYCVSELHNTAISALEWSKNGMKLFSGDKNGHVVLTEIDFYMHLCKSIEILNESYEVVQLSYYQQSLVVSTTYRSIICKREDKWKVSQIGKKDRKVLGYFGGIFFQNSERPNDTVLYCTRPGLRLWVSDLQGCVQQTLLFKDILNQRTPEVQLINPISKNLRKLMPQKEASFGVLLILSNNYLVTCNNDVVYVLDPKSYTVNATVSNLRRVLSVAAYKDELFILEGERSLIRLAEHPEPTHESAPTIPTASSFLPLTTSIKDLTHKLQTSSIISAIPPFIETTFGDLSIHTDPTSVINAEEATESPPLLSPAVPCARIDTESPKPITYDDAVLFKRKKRRKPDLTTSMISWSSNSSEEKEGSVTKPIVMNVSMVGMLPDLRSLESIKQDIENKEKKLAHLLKFDEMKIRLSEIETEKKVERPQLIEKSPLNQKPELDETPQLTDKSPLYQKPQLTDKSPLHQKPLLNEKLQLIEKSTLNEKVNDKSKCELIKENLRQIRESSRSDSESSENVYDFPVKPFNTLSRFTGTKPNGVIQPLAYGPPSGSSNSNSLTDVPVCMNIPSDWQLQTVKVNGENKVSITESSISDLSGEWEII